MEHDDKTLPIKPSFLASLSIKCRAYAKALHYKELEFKNFSGKEGGRDAEIPSELAEGLISIYTLLGETQAADGVLKVVQNRRKRKSHVVYLPNQNSASSSVTTESDIDEDIYAKLGRWQEALEGYRHLREKNPQDPNSLLGMMHCYEALGEWKELYDLVAKVGKIFSQKSKSFINHLNLSLGLEL